ncbi:MAG: hypothetical protein FJZ43_02735 [Candidatus Staskawiczbacteria bacterium]|nr:hypothetical protein [Candidatus Staskawiczbacteria bacterium]
MKINFNEEASKSKKFLFVFFILAIIILCVGLFLIFKSYNFSKNTQSSSQDKAQNIVEKVSKLVILPENETPTIATVTDPGKLKDQPFFSGAKEGFKVLIYANSKKAVLYDPFLNKVVQIGPIIIGDTNGISQ